MNATTTAFPHAHSDIHALLVEQHAAASRTLFVRLLAVSALLASAAALLLVRACRRWQRDTAPPAAANESLESVLFWPTLLDRCCGGNRRERVLNDYKHL